MWSLTLYWVFFSVNTPLPSPCFWQGDVVMMFSFPWLLAVTLCYIIPFNPADGCFLAHHPSSLLPFSLFLSFSTALLWTPLSHTSVFCSYASDPPFVHPSLTSLHCPSFCLNANFTLLMFITSVTACSPWTGSLPVLLSPLWGINKSQRCCIIFHFYLC